MTRTIRPTLDALEGREMMSATYTLFKNGTLVVTCDSANDTVQVRQTATQIVLNGQVAWDVNRVTGVIVHGNGGHDTINLAGVNKPATINGGSGNDFIVGGNGHDLLNGGNDQDNIFGGAGDDVLHGNSGNDRLFGDGGSDSISGESGIDFIDDGNRNAQEWFNSGTGADYNADAWTSNGCQISDINQGQSPTCAFLSSLAAGVDAGINYGSWIRYNGYLSDGTPVYQVKLWHPTGYFWQNIGFDGTTNSYDTVTAASRPSRVAEFESWPILMHRAYVNYASRHSNYTKLDFALATATGAAPVQYTQNDPNLKTALVNAITANRPVVTGVDHNSFKGITNHALAVVGTRGTFNNLEVCLYNPWGFDTANTAKQPAAINGGSATDGYFWVSYDTFKTYFDGGIFVR